MDETAETPGLWSTRLHEARRNSKRKARLNLKKANNFTPYNNSDPIITFFLKDYMSRKSMTYYYHIIYKPSYSTEQIPENRFIPAPSSITDYGKTHALSMVEEDDIMFGDAWFIPYPYSLTASDERVGHEDFPDMNEWLYDRWLERILFKAWKRKNNASIGTPAPSTQVSHTTNDEESIRKGIEALVIWLKEELSEENFQNSFVPDLLGIRADVMAAEEEN